MNVKNAIKKIVAIGAGATMIGATIMGALAYDLGSYPSPFINTDNQFVGKIIIGETAATSDVIGAIDIAAALQRSAKTSMDVSSTTPTVSNGKLEAIDLGNNLNAKFGGKLNADDIPTMQDTSLTIDTNGNENTYDVHDEVQLATTATIDTGLTATNKDEDFKDGTYLLLAKGAVKYCYVFDDTIKAENYLNETNDNNPLEIEFLGRTLTLVGADTDSITAQVGTQLFLNAGDSAEVEAKTVKLIRVGDTVAVVDVDGVQKQINLDETKTVNGLRIKVETIFNDQGVEYDSATLIVGTEAQKTYNDGDPYIGEDKDNPNWVWELSGLTGGDPTICISYDQTIDNPTDNPVTIGEEFSLPGGFVKFALDSYTQKDYKAYTVTAETGVDLYNSTVGEITTSAKALHFHADGGGKDGFKVLTYETDDIYVYYAASTAYGLTADRAYVFYKDHDDNKIKSTAQYVNLGGAVANLTMTNNLFNITYKDTLISIDANVTSTSTDSLYFVFDEQNGNNGANNLQIFATANPTDGSSVNEFSYLGHSDGDTLKAADLYYGTKDISGWQQDTRTQKGLIVSSYDNSAASDKLQIQVPKDISEFKVNVIAKGSSTTSGGGTSGTFYTVNPIAVGMAILDKDASLTSTSKYIVVGGPCVNTIAATLVGNPADNCAQGFSDGTSKIVFYSDYQALLVAGYSAADTVAASKVLANYGDYEQFAAGKTELEVVTSTMLVNTIK